MMYGQIKYRYKVNGAGVNAGLTVLKAIREEGYRGVYKRGGESHARAMEKQRCDLTQILAMSQGSTD